jgi:hypothetical protein
LCGGTSSKFKAHRRLRRVLPKDLFKDGSRRSGIWTDSSQSPDWRVCLVGKFRHRDEQGGNGGFSFGADQAESEEATARVHAARRALDTL